MAVVTIKSTAITNRDSLPVVLSNDYLVKGDVYETVGMANVGATDNALSKYIMCSIPSGAKIVSVKTWSDAILGAATAPTLDLWDTTLNGGLVVKAGFFLAPVYSAATQAGTDLTHTISAANTNNVSQGEKRVWEILGLTADPLKMYDVVLASTVNNATTGANVIISVMYTV